MVILDNLGWYCDVTNVFIRQRQIQIVTRNNVIKIEELLIEEVLILLQKLNYKEYMKLLNRLYLHNLVLVSLCFAVY